ncbi:MAG: protein kinase domain-containing protein [Aggregatilineales bacterium]
MAFQNLTGQTLGQYELRELLGSGGMGAVYRGYQASLKRVVAVKVLPLGLSSQPGYLERFEREATTSASLEHAHIVPVYDYGTQNNVSYIVMRLLTGGSLSDRMAQMTREGKPLPSLGEISELLKQLASALDYAHNQGVIHRDIKPSNVMFDNHGTAYLVDFGIAKLADSTGSSLTGTGMTVGTPSYMPPEQWQGEPVTPASDQYALGVVIYNLVTGHLPFEAPTPFVLMHKHVNEPPTPPSAFRADLPEAVGLVIGRVLSKAPADRFPTVTAFAQAFERGIQGRIGEPTGLFSAAPSTKISALPPTPLPASKPAMTPPTAGLTAGRTGMPSPGGTPTALPTATVPVNGSRRSNSVLIGGAVGLAVLALLIGAALVIIPQLSKNTTASTATLVAQVNTLATTQATTQTVQATTVVVAVFTLTATPTNTNTPLLPTYTPTPTITKTSRPPTNTATSTASHTSAPTRTATIAPSHTSAPTASATVATLAPTKTNIVVVATIPATATPTKTATSSGAIGLALSGTIVFVSDRNAHNTLVQLTIGSNIPPTPLIDEQTVDGPSAWSPDGKQIAFVSYRDGFNRLYVMDSSNSSQARLLTPNLIDVRDPAWSPDGTTIAFDNSGQIWLVNADGSSRAHRAAQGYLPTWAPDGKQIVYVQSASGQHLFVMNADGSNPTRLSRTQDNDSEPAWSPDGKTIAFTSQRSTGDGLYLMDADGSNVRRLTLTATKGTFNIIGSNSTWSPDGKRLAFVVLTGTSSSVYVTNADGSNTRNVLSAATTTIAYQRPSWSPDGQKLLVTQFMPNRTMLSMSPDGSNLRSLDQVWALNFSFSASADKKRLLYNKDDGTIGIIDLTTDTISAIPRLSGSNVALAPDGQHVVYPQYLSNHYELYVVNTDGSGAHAVVTPSSAVFFERLSWSPNGAQISYVEYSEITKRTPYVVNADGSHAHTIGNSGNVSAPVWSPDSKQLLFTDTENGKEQLYLVNADGSGLHKLSDSTGNDLQAAWSPDGKRIAFTSHRSNGQTFSDAVWVMNADGSAVRQVTPNNKIGFLPVWSPDGTHLLFSSDTDGNDQLYTIALDGSDLRRLTDPPYFNGDAIWLP